MCNVLFALHLVGKLPRISYILCIESSRWWGVSTPLWRFPDRRSRNSSRYHTCLSSLCTPICRIGIFRLHSTSIQCLPSNVSMTDSLRAWYETRGIRCWLTDFFKYVGQTIRTPFLKLASWQELWLSFYSYNFILKLINCVRENLVHCIK